MTTPQVHETLEQLGLSKNEAKVYATLVQLGCTSVGKIAKVCKVYRPNVYDALERLKQKGLVTCIPTEGTKLFQAAEPTSLLNWLREKEGEVQMIIDQMNETEEIGEAMSPA